ncbi:primosomal protein N' [Hathewaya histolytica]|uniref:Replication restart protein PriA n=3 Tax=Hathewaya histolytica TaxID=1498 RepID=A0A4V6KDE1_HATHI|nr:primosomal protein N' [Hathewaya histolytica]VTQ90157.1 primosome assembly protein PriA [Hathewaya histolytica]
MNKLANVVINSLSSAIDRLFTYRIPKDLEEHIRIGHRVRVPFGKGNKSSEAFVMEIYEEDKSSNEGINIKYINKICEKYPLITYLDIQLINIMRRKYLCTYMECIKVFLPTGISKGVTFKKKEVLYKIRELEGNYIKEPYTTIINLIDKEKLIKSDIKNKYNISISSVNTLIKHGFISTKEEIVNRFPVKFYTHYEKKELNSMQKNALNTIIHSHKKKFLIHGVTGSGKTEIYLNLVEHMLLNKKQSIVLVPEISLTPQMIERFKGRFGEDVAVFHSRLSDGERFEQWMRVKTGEVNVAVGARSALFLPFKDLGIIIIDEEHEGSYKSETDPKYNAKDISFLISDLKGCKVVLGSATPSLESYYEGINDEISIIKLLNRVSNKLLPRSTIVDMREELEQNNRSIFSRKLFDSIKGCLERNEQVILFLNRRGFSPFVSCRKCGYVFKCKNCDISLTYHANGNLVCHYCGYKENSVNICPKCKSKYVKHFGVGTERVEKEVKKYFPHSKVIRMDFDTTRRKDSYEKLYNVFKNKEADILVGTQMIAKGLDFENVTLVGVLAADISLNYPEFRAAEKTFQLITQVSGRAGRGDKEGEVIIQTYSPDNYSIVLSSENRYEDFFKEEIKIRKILDYPPFSEMLLINISAQEKEEGEEYIKVLKKEIENILDKYDKIKMLGPCPCSVFKLKKEFRWQVIFKGNFSNEFALCIKEIVYKVLGEKRFKNIKIGLDTNPRNLV